MNVAETFQLYLVDSGNFEFTLVLVSSTSLNTWHLLNINNAYKHYEVRNTNTGAYIYVCRLSSCWCYLNCLTLAFKKSQLDN